jgi:hypothetical protein
MEQTGFLLIYSRETISHVGVFALPPIGKKVGVPGATTLYDRHHGSHPANTSAKNTNAR